MKKTIRMNERELHRLISESVKRVLNEHIKHVSCNGKHNYEMSDGSLAFDEWLDDDELLSKKLKRVRLNGKHNYEKPDGSLASKKWFDDDDWESYIK